VRRRQTQESSVEAAGTASVVDPLANGGGDRRRLGDLLVDVGALNDGQLAMALTEQNTSGQRLGSILVEQGVISDKLLAKALAEQMGLELVDLTKRIPAADALALFPETKARDLGIVPLSITNRELEVAVADPQDDRVREALTRLPVDTVRMVIASSSDIRAALNMCYRSLAELDEQVLRFEASDGEVQARAELSMSVALDDDAPVIQVVNKIVTQAMRDRASDIHVEPMDEKMRVRFRIDGALVEALTLPSSMGPALLSRIKIMADMNIVERRRPQDGQFQISVDGHDLDVRVSTTATIWGEKAVLRLLEKSRALLHLGQLGMPPEVHAAYTKIVSAPFGMVICTGPTGAGKTTTLYATLMEISRAEMNVVTIEDPVEYVVPTINQIQINVQAGLTFATGLRSILRQDPDLILVGEMRDLETAQIAVQSALTGHKVLSSLHATDAASAMYRLVDMGIEPFLIASSVIGVVGQRLVRRVCSACADTHIPSPQEMAWYEQVVGDGKSEFVSGKGCSYCSHTGYRGRIGVYEVMAMSDEIRHAVMSSASPQALRALAVEQGMRTLAVEAGQLVTRDMTTIDEVIRTVYVA
jgi:type IV pilus assembly protein PilB